MCGVAGFIGFAKGLDLARQANRIQFHRGPDYQDVWEGQSICLSHQRLSIIDLSGRSNQPLEKDSLVIVFNGEIYNYKELKSKLETTQNVKFDTSSDTEVVLEMFRHYGDACLQELIGMFAFAIHDMESRKTFIARDHFGIKPLFYASNKGRFAFASELKTLVETGCVEKVINYRSLVSAINYLWVSGNETMFKGCMKLPPGHFMVVATSGEYSIERYWQLEEKIIDITEEDAVAQLSDVFRASIERHMVADVPVSSFLSGGLDSSIISVMASKYCSRLSTYTIGTSEEDKKIEKMPDDEKYARQLAEQHNFDHHEIVIKPDIVELLPSIVRSLDEPIGDPAAINTYLICKAAREKGVKVLLSGMGADEIFLGYRRQHATLLALEYQRLPAILRRFINAVVSRLPVKFMGRGLRIVRWARRFLEFANLPVDEAYMRSYSYYSNTELSELFGGKFREEIEDIRKEHRDIFYSKYENDLANQMCNTDLHMFMLGLNETYSDRASMAASVEVRVPFIDKEVVTCAMRLPGRLKYFKGKGKYILKKFAEQCLPDSIIYRPKAAFGAPLRSWISGPMREMVDTLLSKSSIEKRGIMDYRIVRRMIDEDRKGEADHAYKIYQLLTLELWFREFVD